MKLVNLNGPQDVMALLVRRKWWILLPFIGLSASMLVIIALLPQVYVSESLVIIRPRDVPEEFVKDLSAATTTERLSLITEKVLSTTILQRVVDKLEGAGRALPEFQGLSKLQKIERLRKEVEIKFNSGEQLKKGQLPVSAFRIACRNRDALTAQAIVQALTDVFLDEDKKSREEGVYQTADFFQTQVNEASEKQAEADSKLKALKSRRRFELPNQVDTNLRSIERLSGEIQALRRERATYETELSNAEQKLSNTPKQIPKPIAPSVPATRDRKVDEYRDQFAKASQLLDSGKKSTHPDVINAVNTLQRLRESMTAEQIEAAQKVDPPLSAANTDTLQDNPEYQQWELTKAKYAALIKDANERIKENEDAIRAYGEHVNNGPQAEQELNDVVRESTDATRRYQDLNAKLDAARLSESAETQKKGAQFELYDPASLPEIPTKPVKSALAAAGLGASLLIGLLIGFVVDILYQKTWTQSEIASLTGIKVLVEVPRITTKASVVRAQRRRAGFLTSVGLGAVAYGLFLYLVYTHPGFVLQNLNPLLQKLY
jgi:polysaccharide biosynthesis transport protein